MSYVLIKNKGELPIWGFRLLGLSSKDPDKIGQFGTGLKEAIALSLRLGWDMTIYSGTCKIEFSVQEIQGQEEICFMLSEDKPSYPADQWHGLGMHKNFGIHDWTEPWQVMREIVCNAIDEGLLNHDITSNPVKPEEGFTQVTIDLSPDVMEAYNELYSKLLHMREPEYLDEWKSIIKKDEPSPVKIYNKGVWVQTGTSDSLYDYNFSDLKLNESRSADWHHVEAEIYNLINERTSYVANALILALKDNENEYYEWECLNSRSWRDCHKRNPVWEKAFRDIYGDKAVICTTESVFYDRVKKKGKDPVVIGDHRSLDFLRAAKVPNAASLFTEFEVQTEKVYEPDVDTLNTFLFWWEEINTLTNGESDQPTLKLFTPATDTDDACIGRYYDGEILLNDMYLGSDMMVQAIIEEIGHHISGAYDCTTEFQNFWINLLRKKVAG